MTSSNKRQKMRSLSDYRYWKFHFDCLKALNFRSEPPPPPPPPPPLLWTFEGRILRPVSFHCPGVPLTYFNNWEVRVIFLGLKFWLKVYFLGGLWKTPGFLGSWKKHRYFWGCKKRGLRDLFDTLKKKRQFFWVDKFWRCDFLGYKIWTSIGLLRYYNLWVGPLGSIVLKRSLLGFES